MASQQSIGVLIGATRRRIKQRVLAELRPFGLSPQQFGILLVLEEEDALSLHQVATRLGLDDPTTGRIVQKLITKQLVCAVDDPNDRRRFRLHLTTKGKRLTPKLLKIADSVRSAMEHGISAAEKALLLTTLRKILDNLDPSAKPVRRVRDVR